MSLLTYNTVSLPYGLTTEFRQEAVYDETETDRLYTRFDITVRGVIHASYLPWLAPDLTGQLTNPGDVLEVIRSRLLAHRKPLKFEVNGVNLIPEIQSGNIGAVDAKNGPIPRRCVILDMGEESFLFDYALTTHHVDNPSVDTGRDPVAKQEKGNPIVSNRWTETVEVDLCNYSRRTREGKFVLRSDNYDDRIADEYRNQFAVCSIPPGFRRETARYNVAADGLSLSYTLVDHEQFKMPPSEVVGSPGGGGIVYGAFDADGDYLETCVGAGGAIRIGEARCSLKGSKTTDQSRLIDLAVGTCAKVISTRGNEFQGRQLRTPGVAPPNRSYDYILKYAHVRRSLYRNEVEAVVRAQFTAVPERFYGTAGFYGMSTFTPYSDGVRRTPPHSDRGTAFLLLQAAAYYDPTLQTAGQTELANGPLGSPANDVTPVGGQKVQTRTGVEPGRGGRRERS